MGKKKENVDEEVKIEVENEKQEIKLGEKRENRDEKVKIEVENVIDKENIVGVVSGGECKELRVTAM